MNKEKVIQQKIEQLNGSIDKDIDAEVLSAIEQDAELKEELAFVEQLWQVDSFSADEYPSSQMSDKFYQQLELEKRKQTSKSLENQVASSDEENYFLGVDWRSLFFPQPLVQLTLFGVLFTAGWLSNHSVNQPINETSVTTAQLQKQVDSLSSLVALSMLQNQSAAERIAGVNYTKSSQLKTPEVRSKLFKLLNTDRSNAVRLAVVDVLSEQTELSLIQEQLLVSLHMQENPIVQIAMLELLLSGRNKLSREQLVKLLNDDSLDNDVKKYLKPFIEEQPESELTT